MLIINENFSWESLKVGVSHCRECALVFESFIGFDQPHLRCWSIQSWLPSYTRLALEAKAGDHREDNHPSGILSPVPHPPKTLSKNPNPTPNPSRNLVPDPIYHQPSLPSQPNPKPLNLPNSSKSEPIPEPNLTLNDGSSTQHPSFKE